MPGGLYLLDDRCGCPTAGSSYLNAIDALAAEIDALGPVAHLIAPNVLHHTFGDAAACYPDATPRLPGLAESEHLRSRTSARTCCSSPRPSRPCHRRHPLPQRDGLLPPPVGHPVRHRPLLPHAGPAPTDEPHGLPLLGAKSPLPRACPPHADPGLGGRRRQRPPAARLPIQRGPRPRRHPGRRGKAPWRRSSTPWPRGAAYEEDAQVPREVDGADSRARTPGSRYPRRGRGGWARRRPRPTTPVAVSATLLVGA